MSLKWGFAFDARLFEDDGGARVTQDGKNMGLSESFTSRVRNDKTLAHVLSTKIEHDRQVTDNMIGTVLWDRIWLASPSLDLIEHQLMTIKHGGNCARLGYGSHANLCIQILKMLT